MGLPRPPCKSTLRYTVTDHEWVGGGSGERLFVRVRLIHTCTLWMSLLESVNAPGCWRERSAEDIGHPESAC